MEFANDLATSLLAFLNLEFLYVITDSYLSILENVDMQLFIKYLYITAS